MRKMYLFILSSVLLVSLFVSCTTKNMSNTSKVQISSNEATIDVRQIVFEQLTSESKDKIQGTWRDAKLSTTILNENMGVITDKSYIGKEVYAVDFPTQNILAPNNMIVFVSKDNYTLIGNGYID